MLSGTHFYYRSIRRNVVAFGTMFKDIQLVTYNNVVSDGSNAANAVSEIKRVTVPLGYGDREDWYIRLKQAPNMPIPTDLPLPRMQFRISRIYYDPSRKQQSLLQQYAQAPGAPSFSNISIGFVPVPYNIDFTLEIIVRNTEDGLQIVEQILPFFTPSFTLKMVFLDDIGLSKNIPITLNSVDRTLDNEGATDWTMRRDVWTLQFTMQTYLFGPASQSGLITQANTNLWLYEGSQASGQTLDITLQPGFLTYQTGEVVFQGTDLQHATAVGYVQAFRPSANLLSIFETKGTFLANQNVKGAITSASWNVAAMPVVTPLATIEVVPVPASINIGEDFGFVTTITEFPQA